MNKLDTWVWHSLLAWLKSTLPKMDDCSFASYTISCVSLALVHDHFHFQWNVFGSLLCIAYFCESSKNEKNTKFNEDILVITIMMICWIALLLFIIEWDRGENREGRKDKGSVHLRLIHYHFQTNSAMQNKYLHKSKHKYKENYNALYLICKSLKLPKMYMKHILVMWWTV